MYIDIIQTRDLGYSRFTFIAWSDVEAKSISKSLIRIVDISDNDWIRDTESFTKTVCQCSRVAHTAEDKKLIIVEIKTPIASEVIKKKYEEFFEEKYPAYISQF